MTRNQIEPQEAVIERLLNGFNPEILPVTKQWWAGCEHELRSELEANEALAPKEQQ